MQIFSRQATMMDALISHFAEQMRRRKDESDPLENIADDGEYKFKLKRLIFYLKFFFYILFNYFFLEPNPIQNSGVGVLSNKFSRLTCCTFDDEGRCIGQMGSLTISY